VGSPILQFDHVSSAETKKPADGQNFRPKVLISYAEGLMFPTFLAAIFADEPRFDGNLGCD
jgi:hypothetical protein